LENKESYPAPLLDQEEEEEQDKLGDADATPSGAYELRESLSLTKEDCLGDLEVPYLVDTMIPEVGSAEFVVWMNRHRTPPLGQGQMHYVLHGRESTKGLDPASALISFYQDDARFEPIWSKLKDHTQRFLNAGVWALTMPDFTTTSGWPLPKNLWNLYRCFYTAAYWQKSGLMVVPNLIGYDEASIQTVCEAIPQGCPVVSKQLQTCASERGGRKLRSGDGQDGASADDIRRNVGFMLEQIKPKAMICYGGERGLILGQELCKRHGVQFIGVENRATAAMELNQERGL